MGANEPDRHGPSTGRTATTPLDPMTVARGTEDAFRRLIHEIAGLIDGSLRYLRIVQRDLEHSPGVPPPASSLANLDVATDALARVASLVHDANGAVTHCSSINVGRRLSAGRSLREIIEHAVTVIRPLAEEHAVSVEASLAPSIDQAPPLPLYPVFINALKNGVEACAGGDRVIIRAWVEDDDGRDALCAEITDTGPGTLPDPERLFSAGYTTKQRGCGLGLAIARDIVHELGGTIGLAPNPEGRGARLMMRVPLLDEERA